MGPQNIVVVSEIAQCTPGCCLLGLSSAASFTPSERLPPDLHFHREAPGVWGAPLLEEAVARTNLESGLDEGLKRRFRIEGDIGWTQGKEMLFKKFRRATKSVVKKEGGHDRFKRCREQGRPLSAIRLFAFSQAEHGGKSQVFRRLG